MSVVALKFQRAVASYQMGQSHETDQLCREILSMEPRHCDALHLRGLAALHQGKVQAGIDLIARSLAVNPDQAIAHSNLGNALLESNRLDQAMLAFNRALKLDARLALALSGLGRALLVMGRCAEALAVLDRLLKQSPNDVQALHDSARALFQLGRVGEGTDRLERALLLQPGSAGLLNDYGNGLIELGRTEDALTSLDRALTLEPDFPEALSNRGLALLKSGRLDEAIVSLDRALEIRPTFFAALSNRGNAYLRQDRHGDALIDFDRALATGVDTPEAHNNRSAALVQLKRFDEALASAERALALEPVSPEALNNRGLALTGLSRFEEAEAIFTQALKATPASAQVSQNLAHVLLKLNRPQDALRYFDLALFHDPASASTHFNRAAVLLNSSRFEEAAEAFDTAMKLSPDLPYVSGMLLYANLNCGDWTDYSRRLEEIRSIAASGGKSVNPLETQLFLDSPSEQLACTRAYVREQYAAPESTREARVKYSHEKIRVAYLSTDFREHPVAHVAARVFELHDRDRFETIAIGLESPASGDRMHERLIRAFTQFHSVSHLSDREVAHKLQELEIDIAVDLNGHTNGGRLGIFASRPAPIQVSYLGFPGTTGADYMDYLIADSFVVAHGQEQAFSEHIVRLPDTYLPYDDTTPTGAIPTRAQAGLPESGFVFCAFNSSFKINPAIFDVWMRILNRTPDSVLWLRSVNDATARNFRREARARGVAEERLVFAPRTPTIAEHVARTRLADLFLDTHPYNAHSTACDALWAGVPVLTRAGDSFAGRVAASVLHAIGLSDLVTQSHEEYETLACTLAGSPALLAECRGRLAVNRTTHSLFDTDRYRRHLEAAYVAMWERAQRGEPPSGFNVRPLPSASGRKVKLQ